jgi:hypothetical protein
MASRAAQQALSEGRLVLLRAGGARGSGITDLGVLLGEGEGQGGAGSAGGSGASAATRPRGIDDFFGGGSAGGVGGGAAAAASGTGGLVEESGAGAGTGRKYIVLYLHRASPLDAAVLAPPAAQAALGGASQQQRGVAAAPPPPPADLGAPGGLPGEPMLVLKKKVGRAAGGRLRRAEQ